VNRLIERCSMLDVHKAQVTACVRVPDGDGGRRQEIREFRTTTAGLITLADWLGSYAVTVVGMESTGVYWRAIYYLLEDEFECQLFNARHLRHVPGRKSDVQDAERGCQLIEHGLVRTSFVPPRPLRELRDLVRSRKANIQERGREVQRVRSCSPSWPRARCAERSRRSKKRSRAASPAVTHCSSGRCSPRSTFWTRRPDALRTHRGAHAPFLP